MKNKAAKFITFLLINFAALGIGAYLQGIGPMGEWYQSLQKAPWTPPGWVFGVAWFSIMICYSFYLTSLFEKIPNRTFFLLFAAQFVLNVSWNPIFFAWHQMFIALIVICLLTILIGYKTFNFFPKIKGKTLLILPYFIWLLIATSLNLYSLLSN